MRGIVDPDRMLDLVDFRRFDAGPMLDGIVEWFWSVAWDLPQPYTQRVLNHPAGNVSIGTIDDDAALLDPPEGRVYGVHRETSERHLSGKGWTVAARTTVGGLGILIDGRARTLADAGRPLPDGVPGLAPTLVAEVSVVDNNASRVELLQSALSDVVASRPAARVEEALEVVRLAALAEHDRSITRTEQLAEAGAVSVRTLQRMFDEHVGATPKFVIRRWRIIEAADAAAREARDGSAWRGWATVAAELGYADQAHLGRDFKLHLGETPSAYLARNRA